MADPLLVMQRMNRMNRNRILSAKNIYLTPTDFYVRKNMPVATEINTILTEEFDKVFAGAQSVEETLQNAQKRADEKIAQEQ